MIYANRDIEQLDADGNYFSRHLDAMTKEELHSKINIAAELGYRDKIIDDLLARVEALVEEHNAQAICAEEFAKTMADNAVLKSQLANLEADVKDNAHYREEAVINLDRAEKAEAQLARCVIQRDEAMEWNWMNDDVPQEIVDACRDDTNRTAALDAEILRAAKDFYCNPCEEEHIDVLFEAIRAREKTDER